MSWGERLRQQIVRPLFECELCVLITTLGERDDGHVESHVAAAKQLDDLVTIHPRHSQVEKDQIRTLVHRLCERLHSVAGRDDIVMIMA